MKRYLNDISTFPRELLNCAILLNSFEKYDNEIEFRLKVVNLLFLVSEFIQNKNTTGRR